MSENSIPARPRPYSVLRSVVMPGLKPLPALLAGFGAFLTILLLAELTARAGAPLLIAPFGASCVVVFALPKGPLARPRNVIGGHLISATIGLAVLHLLGPSPAAYAIGVGLATAAMALTDTLHPPAGADPIVVVMTGAAWPFLLMPILGGALLIVAMALCFRRLAVRYY
ncbi:MAG: HPP family protein [Azospirillaceae bacterium]|nr:HPP family protein [Azospirillaceae bacterium]